MKPSFVQAFVLACIIVAATMAAAPVMADVVAVVTAIRGEVTVERAGSEVSEAAEIGAGLAPGDALRTAPGAFATVMLHAGPVRQIDLAGDRRWQAPALAAGLAWAPGLRTERVAAVFRSADLPPSILLPRWTRSEGLPFGLNWSREFPELDVGRVRIFDLDADDDSGYQLQLEGRRGVVIPGGSLTTGRHYRWQLLGETETALATGHFEVIGPAALAKVRSRLAALPEIELGEAVDWMVLQQTAVLVDEQLYLLAGRLLAEAVERRPDDEVLRSWMVWVARMAASPAQLPSRKNAAQ